MLSWLYPIATVISLILLASPEMRLNPLLAWHDWADTIASVHIGHLFTQIIVSAVSWTAGIKLKFSVNIMHYSTACAINIICLSSQQMAALVLVGIAAQLPILFSTINSIICRSMCPCLWIFNWLFWILFQTACTFVIPGFFLIKPLINHGVPQGLSTVAVIALFWAISYFAILFLWEMHRPLKALFRPSDEEEVVTSQPTHLPFYYTERTPLVSAERLTEVKNQISVP